MVEAASEVAQSVADSTVEAGSEVVPTVEEVSMAEAAATVADTDKFHS